MSPDLNAFRKTVWDYYQAYGRQLPWRKPGPSGFDPYRIMVSEVMLQQTQVNRVVPKYEEFLSRFPKAEALSKASLAEVIKLWSGLGYNRRARYLHQAAKTIVNDHQGVFPKTVDELSCLPGIGSNTAAAILVYAHNQPLVFIETNIRTVYIHHFFHGQSSISDKQLLPLIGETLDRECPREWYWALMDYGSYLKAASGNASQRSHHYKKQSTFEGSMRQLRGAILRTLADRPMAVRKIKTILADERTGKALDSLQKDGLVQKRGTTYQLAE